MASSSIIDRDRYEALFDDAGDAPVRGEATPYYLCVPKAPVRIHELIPDAKLVAVLRNPVDRAWSSYQHLVREDLEPLSLDAALDAEPQRIRENYGYMWRYVELGRYAEQLERYEELFPKSQLKVLLYDDLAKDTVTACQSIFEFVGVDPTFTPDVSLRHNLSGVPKSRLVHRALNPPATVKRALWDRTPKALRERLLAWQVQLTNRNLERQKMDPAVRARLVDIFSPEISRLEERLGRDLSGWRR